MSKTTKLFMLGLLSLALRSPSAIAEEAATTLDNKEAFRTAFDACSEQYQRPEPGSKPSDDFKACMKAAGFDGPPDRGGHHGGRGHGPRPEGPPPDAQDSRQVSSDNSGGAQ